MTQILNADRQGLIFEIISARISEQPEDKKYVIYNLQVRFISGNDDLTPSVIERRYTQFQNLYNSLKKDFPLLMTDINFPKKVITGNFDNELISTRSTAFESILKHISQHSKLRTSKAMQIFLQEPELTEVKKMYKEKLYITAVTLLENVFKLLNKVFSDRSYAVLLTLCRLVAYCSEAPIIYLSPHSLRWADLALYRFDGVSDSDLLELYIPLLRACFKIYQASDKDTEGLTTQLQDFQRQGMKGTEDNKGLLIAVDEIEERTF